MRPLPRILVFGALLLAAVTPAGPPLKGAEEAPESAEAGTLKPADHDRAIEFFLKRIERNPQGSLNYAMLATRYLRKARETGDESCYPKAEAALREALQQSPKDKTARLALAGVLCTRHQFAAGLALAEELLAENPDDLEILATVFDAQLELGQYAIAEETLKQLEQKIDRIAPGLLVRQAHLAELRGNTAEAIRLQKVATSAALKPAGDNVTPSLAWYQVRLGHLYLDNGQVEAAAGALEAAAQAVPQYFLAAAALAELRTVQERYADAIAEYQRTIALAPDPIFYMALGDLYVKTKKPDLAEEAYHTAEEILVNEGATPAEIARELSLFYSERARKPEKALELAKIDLEYRQDVWGHDALAWALYRNGKFDEAQAAMQQALRLGTRSAKMHYHAGMIAAKLGQRDAAAKHLQTALEINPHFHVLGADEARQTLAELK